MPDRVFPNLFLVGAMKAGTSSLHEYLHQHPDIFMSRMKEPQYFAPHATRWGQKWGQGNPYPEPGIDWYLRLFEDAADARYAGESSVSYAARPWLEGCEQRIYDFNPNARIIYLMRDPVERAISHYWHFVADGREDRPPAAAVRQTKDYVARSNYPLQLRPYLERFGPEQVFTLTLEELGKDPALVFRRLFQWLDVDPDVVIDTTQRHNQRGSTLRQSRRGFARVDTMLKHWRWRRFEARLPSRVHDFLHKLPYRVVDRRQVDTTKAIEILRERLAPTVDELEVLLGKEFNDWPMTQPRRTRPEDGSSPGPELPLSPARVTRTEGAPT